MSKPPSILVLVMLLVFGLFAAVPAADLPETAYDESEGVPYESTPLIAEVMPLAVLTTAAATSLLHLPLTTPSQAIALRIDGADTHRSAEGQVALALLCTLVC